MSTEADANEHQKDGHAGVLKRSRRKHSEATFFLEHLSETNGVEPAFGYYMSAFLSAWRSIGFVLQKDLRGRFGAEFDSWWEEAKAGLPTPLVSFAVINELRNQALKEGRVLYRLKMMARVDDPFIEQVSFMLDLGKSEIEVVSEEYTFRESNPIEVRVSGDNFHVPFETALGALKKAFRSLYAEERNIEASWVEYQLLGSASAVPFTQLLTALREHLDGLGRIIANAEERFRSDDPKGIESP